MDLCGVLKQVHFRKISLVNFRKTTDLQGVPKLGSENFSRSPARAIFRTIKILKNLLLKQIKPYTLSVFSSKLRLSNSPCDQKIAQRFLSKRVSAIHCWSSTELKSTLWILNCEFGFSVLVNFCLKISNLQIFQSCDLIKC